MVWRARGFARDRDIVGIAAECTDIGLDPFQRFDLVEQPVIARHMIGRFRAQPRMRQIAEHAEAIVDRHDDHALFGELRTVVHRLASRSGNERAAVDPHRSEEHTSELQSLMRLSYAVLCLHKTNTTTNITTK